MKPTRVYEKDNVISGTSCIINDSSSHGILIRMGDAMFFPTHYNI